jgi:amidase
MLRKIRRAELNGLARDWHFSLDEGELDEFHNLTEYVLGILNTLDHQDAAPAQTGEAVRDPGRRPAPSEDPYNAIVRWCNVKAATEGILSGARLGFKDAIAVAGIPMTCGSRVLQGFVPTRDSVVAERVLRAGGEIVAMTNMDNLAFSAGGDTSAYGSTLNPFDTTRTAGGSSGGSAAALWYDSIDITLGGDQGGSIRVPAAWCGVLGLKPTHSLVPYTSIAGIDQTFDHCGPMARRAADAARVLQAIAGRHESDPRQRDVPVQDYVKAVAEARDDLTGVKIGIVPEGFSDAVGIEKHVGEAVSVALDRFRKLGAEVRQTPVPEHLQAGGIAFAGFIEGMTALIAGGGNGYHWQGAYWPEFALALGQGLAAFGDELSPQMKLTLICGTFLRKHYFGSVYARAQNLRPLLRAGYDRALREVDYLVMPTTPVRAHVDDPKLPISEHVKRGWGMLANTAPTDMTGHPALTIPAAEAGGLPVGVMFIGKHFDDAGLLALARTYEQRFDWVPTLSRGPRA